MPQPLPLRLMLLQGLLEAHWEGAALDVRESVIVEHEEGVKLTVPLGELCELPVATAVGVECSEAVEKAVPLPQPLGVDDSSVLAVAIALPLPQPLPLAVPLPVAEGVEEALGQALALAEPLAVRQALLHADGERLPEALPEKLGALLAVLLPLPHRLALLHGLLEAHCDDAALAVRESVLVEHTEPDTLKVALMEPVEDMLGAPVPVLVPEAQGLAVGVSVGEGVLEAQLDAVAHAHGVALTLAQEVPLGLLLCDTVVEAQALALPLPHAVGLPEGDLLMDALPLARAEALLPPEPDVQGVALRVPRMEGVMEREGVDVPLAQGVGERVAL